MHSPTLHTDQDGKYEGETKIMTTVSGEEIHVRHGMGTYAYPGGFFTYAGEWSNGKKHGTRVPLGCLCFLFCPFFIFLTVVSLGRGTLTLKDGTTYTGQYINGELNGQGVRTWPDGSTYTGDFKLGEASGQGSYVGTDGRSYEGSWQEGHMQGEGVLISPLVYRGKHNTGC